MTLSPLQMTPSQSKMKTSTSGRREVDGSVSLRTLAWREVGVRVVNVRVVFGAAAVKARAVVAIRAVESADLRMCMIGMLLIDIELLCCC